MQSEHDKQIKEIHKQFRALTRYRAEAFKFIEDIIGKDADSSVLETLNTPMAERARMMRTKYFAKADALMEKCKALNLDWNETLSEAMKKRPDNPRKGSMER